MKVNKDNIGSLLDLSAIKTDTSRSDIAMMVDLAKAHNCACIFTFSAHLPYAVELLGDRKDILVGGVVGFPTGSTTSEMKREEAAHLVELGVNELDMVLNVTWMKEGEHQLVENDIRGVINAAGGLPVKVILECHYLTEKEIIDACDIAIRAGASYIKTGTGWAPTGATLENIALIAKTVDGRCKVKAAGGVKDLQTIEAMTDLGVTRFGVGLTTAQAILKQCQ